MCIKLLYIKVQIIIVLEELILTSSTLLGLYLEDHDVVFFIFSEKQFNFWFCSHIIFWNMIAVSRGSSNSCLNITVSLRNLWNLCKTIGWTQYSWGTRLWNMKTVFTAMFYTWIYVEREGRGGSYCLQWNTWRDISHCRWLGSIL